MWVRRGNMESNGAGPIPRCKAVVIHYEHKTIDCDRMSGSAYRVVALLLSLEDVDYLLTNEMEDAH